MIQKPHPTVRQLLELVFVSVRSRTPEFAALRPYAHLLKLFSLRALGSALAAPPR